MQKPWMTDGIVKSCLRKEKLYLKYKKISHSMQRIRIMLQFILESETIGWVVLLWLRSQSWENSQDMRKTWIIINGHIGNSNIDWVHSFPTDSATIDV